MPETTGEKPGALSWVQIVAAAGIGVVIGTAVIIRNAVRRRS